MQQDIYRYFRKLETFFVRRMNENSFNTYIILTQKLLKGFLEINPITMVMDMEIKTSLHVDVHTLLSLLRLQR